MSEFSPTKTEDRSWKVLQRRGNGEIASVLRDLTREEAEFIKARIEGLPATPEEKRAAEEFAAEQDRRWREWLIERGLDPHSGHGGTSSPSCLMKNGYPMRGCDHSPIQGDGWRRYGPNDIVRAEVFQ